jgi:hypothetical protein
MHPRPMLATSPGTDQARGWRTIVGRVAISTTALTRTGFHFSDVQEQS